MLTPQKVFRSVLLQRLVSGWRMAGKKILQSFWQNFLAAVMHTNELRGDLFPEIFSGRTEGG
ncbi:MAG: hypothetical protein Q4G66_03005 [bacterium]|nr:hypothetical protein [bacterium]